jgi:muconolactone delta-isomerase
MELVGSPPAKSPQEMVEWLERVIIPSEEAVLRMEKEGHILAGGDLSGRRGWALIMEAASNEALSQLLEGIPEWPFLDVEITPLDRFQERLAHVRRGLERMKQNLA